MPSYARTLRDVINGALRLCGDYRGDGVSGKIWSWSEVRTMIQDELLDLCRRTGILKESRIIFLEEDEQVYDLPPDCIRILRVGINKFTGAVVLPTSISERDYQGLARSSEGTPLEFYRDHTLAPNQIGFIPTPNEDGSKMTRDQDYGLLRRVTNADGDAMTFDDNLALRRITGVPISLSGDGQIIRDFASLYGNVWVNYVRAPAKWEKEDEYPDSDFPEYVHKDFKYLTAIRMLKMGDKAIHGLKKKRFQAKWIMIEQGLQRNAEHHGEQSWRPI